MHRTFLFPESTFWQLEKQIWHRSRKNTQGFQTTPAFCFHLCCKTRLITQSLLRTTATNPHLCPWEMVQAGFPWPHGQPGRSPARHKARTFTFLSFSYSKLSIRFHHILLKQLHQENDSACGINYACAWPGTKGYEVGEGRIVRHTQIKSPWISQMDPISSSYCRKSSCT